MRLRRMGTQCRADRSVRPTGGDHSVSAPDARSRLFSRSIAMFEIRMHGTKITANAAVSRIPHRGLVGANASHAGKWFWISATDVGLPGVHPPRENPPIAISP